MTRNFRVLFVLAALVLLASGPLLASPVLRSTAPTLTAPRSGLDWPALATLAALAGSLAVVGITIRKDTATLAGKFVARAQAAAPDYKSAVVGAGGVWESETKAAETNYEAGVQAAIGRKSFGKGVAGKAGKFQTNAAELGSVRYGPGIAQAKGAWQAGVEPAFNVLKSLQLPPKGPRRSPQNQARANAVAIALGAMKEK